MKLTLTEEQKEKLIILGLNSLLEKMELINFPVPAKLAPIKNRKKWSPEHRRKFMATVRRKRDEKK